MEAAVTTFDQWYASKYYGHPWEPKKEALREAWEAGAESAPITYGDKVVAAINERVSKLPAKAIEGHLMARAAASPIRGSGVTGNTGACDAPILGSSPSPLTITPEAIYAAYPRKVGKQAAIKAIKRVPSKWRDGGFKMMKYLLERTQAYAAAVATWPEEDKKFIPHPATWFNQGRYDDDPKEWQRGKPEGQYKNAF